jgi:hypothetical protein
VRVRSYPLDSDGRTGDLRPDPRKRDKEELLICVVQPGEAEGFGVGREGIFPREVCLGETGISNVCMSAIRTTDIDNAGRVHTLSVCELIYQLSSCRNWLY